MRVCVLRIANKVFDYASLLSCLTQAQAPPSQSIFGAVPSEALCMPSGGAGRGGQHESLEEEQENAYARAQIENSFVIQ